MKATVLVLLIAVLAATSTAVTSTADAAEATDTPPAPTRLFAQPDVEGLITLNGEYTTLRYAVGYLNRAAELQYLLDPALRAFNSWTGTKLDINVYVLSREQWQQARIRVPYGVPVRIGRLGIAVPAHGDEASYRMWADAISVALPAAPDTLFRGSPQDATALVMADILALIEAAEILVDEAGIAGTQFWVRGLVAQMAVNKIYRRHDPNGLKELDRIYDQILQQRPEKPLAATDYRADINLKDWLWFQAQFHFGAQAVLDKEGRGTFKTLRKLRKRGDGALTGAALLDKYKPLADWYYSNFSAISTRPS